MCSPVTSSIGSYGALRIQRLGLSLKLNPASLVNFLAVSGASCAAAMSQSS